MVCRLHLNKAVRETKGLRPSHTLRGPQFLKKHKTKRSCVWGGGNRKGSPAAVVGNGAPAWDADKETDFQSLSGKYGTCWGLLRTGTGLRPPCTDPRWEHFSWAPVTSPHCSQAWEGSLHLRRVPSRASDSGNSHANCQTCHEGTAIGCRFESLCRAKWLRI